MKHLCAVEGFREQGTLYEATCDPEVPQSMTTALAWGNTSARVSTLAQLEDGEVQESVGGHLAEYVDCPNETTWGCTRTWASAKSSAD